MLSLTRLLEEDKAVDAVVSWMLENDYTARCRAGVAAHLRRHGELAGCVPEHLDREDEATATAIYESSLPEVPYADADAWGSADGSLWNPLDDRWHPGPDPGAPLPPICGGSDEADRAVPPSAVLVPPELELLDELLDALVVFDDDRTEDPAAEPCPCTAGTSDPCRCGDDPRIPDAPDMLPPITGGCEDDAAWADEPTHEEWDAMEIDSREWPRYGYE